MINRKSHTPLYIQLADHLRKQIVLGNIKVGDKLPSETEMIKEYKLGRLTIRDSLSILQNEGLIEKQHGKGTFCKAAFVQPQYRVDILLNLSDMYFVPHYLRSICSVLEKEDVKIVLNDTKDNPDTICSVLDKIASEGTDGVLFQPSSEAGNAPENLISSVENLITAGIPYIMIDSAYDNIAQSYVVVNETQSGIIAANYFKSLGHRALCMIVKDGHFDSFLREKGFSEELDTKPYIISHSKELEVSLSAMLKSHPEITGILCYNDNVAKDCYEILNRLSISVPDDISIVSVDDTVIASALSPALTSIVHPKGMLGEDAAKAILSIIQKKADWPYQKTFEPSLNIRKSCRPL